jgi:hypothetical protein
MKVISSSLRLTQFSRRAVLLGAVAASAALTGCYVVPIHPQTGQPQSVYSTPQALPVPSAPLPVTFAARLYPANDAAARYGLIGAVVTNDLNGRGTFTTNINGESFSGEATRLAGSSASSSREGVANGAGNRGSFINCKYQMNSTTLGTGQCKLSNGALFTMHVGG